MITRILGTTPAHAAMVPQASGRAIAGVRRLWSPKVIVTTVDEITPPSAPVIPYPRVGP